MKKIISILAYIWAFICVLVIAATFMFNYQFAELFSKLPFMKINPKYSGGTVSRVKKEKNGLTVSINKPVFESIIGESSTGFVQIKFTSNEKLPAHIEQNIDYNNDNKTDFNIDIDTVNGKTALKPLNPTVTGLLVSGKVKNHWIIKVGLNNK